MFYFILSIHLFLCLILVGLVLLQQGKGADMGAAFGGGSNSLFGAGGATAMITKITTGVAVAFFVTSVILVNQFAAISRGSRVSTDPIAGSVMGSEPAPVAPDAQMGAAPKAQPVAGGQQSGDGATDNATLDTSAQAKPADAASNPQSEAAAVSPAKPDQAAKPDEAVKLDQVAPKQ